MEPESTWTCWRREGLGIEGLLVAHGSQAAVKMGPWGGAGGTGRSGSQS